MIKKPINDWKGDLTIIREGAVQDTVEISVQAVYEDLSCTLVMRWGKPCPSTNIAISSAIKV